MTQSKAKGYLYVITCGEVCKVGYSVNPELRKQSLESTFQALGKMNIVFVAEAENPRGAEKAAHNILAEKRVRWEWFEVAPEVAIEAVKAGIENPVDMRPIAKSTKEQVRLRPVGYFDTPNPIRINPNGKRHPDLILG
jgi:hypothetical protein